MKVNTVLAARSSAMQVQVVRSAHFAGASGAFVAAALVYATTLYFAGVEYLALVVVASIPFWPRAKPAPDLLVFCALVCVSHVVGAVMGLAQPSLEVFGVFFVVAMPFAARLLSERVRYWLVCFAALEAAIAIYEMASGQQFLFSAQAAGLGLGDDTSDLLYDVRSFGLSSNSSAAAEKIMLGLMLLPTLRIGIDSAQKYALGILLLLGAIATYNKSALFGLLAFWVLLPKPGHSYIKSIAFKLSALLLAGALCYLAFDAFLSYQLGRGSEDIEVAALLSGREEIWSLVLKFIGEHPLFGNFGTVYLVDYYGRYEHAHNSFLALVASYGSVPAFFYLVYVCRLTTRKNLPWIAGILVFSTTQFGVFWKLSYVDLMFHAALLSSWAGGRWTRE